MVVGLDDWRNRLDDKDDDLDDKGTVDDEETSSADDEHKPTDEKVIRIKEKLKNNWKQRTKLKTIIS